MERHKVDGVVDSVHYKPGGEIAWVRAYQRRGATFSDLVLIDRKALISHLKSGKKYVAGRRVPLMASTFEITKLLRVVTTSGGEALVAGDAQADHDHLEGVPVL